MLEVTAAITQLRAMWLTHLITDTEDINGDDT